MKYCSNLYAGDAGRIVRAAADGPLAARAFVLAHVILPGFVPDASGTTPHSPDLLTELACDAVGTPRFSFAASIAEHLAGDPDLARATSGTYALDARWAALFAGMTERQRRDLALRWTMELDPVAARRAGPVSWAAAVIRSIEDVCRVSLERQVSLLYSWSSRRGGPSPRNRPTRSAT